MSGKQTDGDPQPGRHPDGGSPAAPPPLLAGMVGGGAGPASPDDPTLVAAIAAGDRQALATLYDRHASRLLGLAIRLMGNPLDAEDLLHDLFLEVFYQAHRYDRERGSVFGWIVMRLRSRAIDRLRSPHYRRLVALDSAPAAVEEAATEERRPADPIDAALVRAVAELPADTQSILDLVYFKGMSLGEVASTMMLPLGTVKSRLHRALRSLRLAVGEEPGS